MCLGFEPGAAGWKSFRTAHCYSILPRWLWHSYQLDFFASLPTSAYSFVGSSDWVYIGSICCMVVMVWIGESSSILTETTIDWKYEKKEKDSRNHKLILFSWISQLTDEQISHGLMKTMYIFLLIYVHLQMQLVNVILQSVQHNHVGNLQSYIGNWTGATASCSTSLLRVHARCDNSDLSG